MVKKTETLHRNVQGFFISGLKSNTVTCLSHTFTNQIAHFIFINIILLPQHRPRLHQRFHIIANY